MEFRKRALESVVTRARRAATEAIDDTAPLPLLSVVVPVRNGMPFIKEALNSILEETSASMELIVRENGSTDGTLEWLRTIDDPRVKIVVSPDSVSAAENWTQACQLAEGKFTKILCADDYVCQGGLKNQLNAALRSSEVALVASRRQVTTEAGAIVFPHRGLRGMKGTHSGAWAVRKAVMSGGNPFGEPASVLFRTDALKASLPFSGRFPYVTDLEMYVKVLQHGTFVGLHTVDASFRLNSSSWSQDIGVGQLNQYRAWIQSLEHDGLVKRSHLERLVSDTKIFITFVARRLITTLLGLFAH